MICVTISLLEYVTLNEERNDDMGYGEYVCIGFKNISGKTRNMNHFLELLFEEPAEEWNGSYGADCQEIYDDFLPEVYYLLTEDDCDIEFAESSDYVVESEEDKTELFYLLNELFGKTYVYSENGTFNTVNDYYYREERIYDPCKCKKLYGERDVCYGDESVFGENIWNVAKEYIEHEAREEGIVPEWSVETDGTIKPDKDNNEFDEFCEEYASFILYDKYGTKKSETDIEMREPSKEFIDKIVVRAKETNNTELLAILSEKFEIA